MSASASSAETNMPDGSKSPRALTDAAERIDVSVVCSPGRYAGDLAAVHAAYREEISSSGRKAEFLYVLNGRDANAEASIARIDEPEFPVRILRMPRGYDEAAGLQYAFEHARGAYVLTIPDRFQIDPGITGAVLEKLDEGHEVVLTHRHPRRDAMVNRLQSALFHLLSRNIYDQTFKDMSCGMRGFTRDAARKLDLYGDLHRFIPILAARKGFRITEIPGAQQQADMSARVFPPGVYARRLLDILQLFFLTRFTSKPLRFFGLIGMTVGIVGAVICAYLAYSRLIGQNALADRPLLLLGVLLVLLGVQVTSTGLIGEIVIFFSAERERPEVEELHPEDDGERGASA